MTITLKPDEQNPDLSQGFSYKILVVDDEPLVRWSISEVFNKAGFKVNSAASVIEAKEQLHEGYFDLVITDLKMPGDDGFSLVSEVKVQSPSCPVIMISAYGDDASRKKAKEMGINYFVDKPVRLSELVLTSTNILNIKNSDEQFESNK